jgi:hypothetical protein
MANKTAATISIDDSELRQLLARIKRDAPGKAQGIVKDTAQELLENLRDDWLNRPGSGRLYESATGQGMHRASAPGEPPAPDTQSYRESWDETRTDALGLSRIVYTPDERGPKLEYGTMKILPRPHAMPAAVAHKRFFENAVRAAARSLERGSIL